LSKATGKAYFRVNQKTSGNTYKLFSTSKYPLDGNTWVHLVGIFNRDEVQIYFNGNLENSMPGPANIVSSTDNLKIGGPDDSRYFKGTIDEVRIWNRALRCRQVQVVQEFHTPCKRSLQLQSLCSKLAGECETD
jgi:hypothetical protein